MTNLKKYFGNSKGFTLLELTLVIIIIGILLAVIVPRALRANVDAKYAIVRQSASELASWGMEWAQRNLDSQDSTATCNMNNYVATLAGYVGDGNNTNWLTLNNTISNPLNTNGQCRTGTDPVTYSVSDIVDEDNQPRNPFNGLSYFNISGGNNGSELQAGLLYLAVHPEIDAGNTINHYYFIYTGTDSQNTSQWHAGMGQGLNPFANIAGLRNGIFVARLVQ